MNTKQARFVDEYLVDANGAQAAIRAGYSEHTARQQASDLLTKPDIQTAIASKTQKVATRLELTAEFVLTGLMQIAANGEREANRVRSFELLGKHLALFADRLEITQVPSSDLVHQWIEALTADVHSNT